MAACTIALALLVTVCVAQIMTTGDWDPSTGEWVEGMAAHQAMRESEQELAGTLDNDRVNADLATYDQARARYDERFAELDAMGSSEVIRTYGVDYWRDVYRVACMPYYQRLWSAIFPDDNLETRACSLQEGAESALSLELSGRYLGFYPYTQVEQDYWKDKASHIEWPIEYGHAGAWDEIFDWVSFIVLAILAACIAVSGVFAGEYQSRTAAVVLPTKRGKRTLPIAKATASLLFVSAYYLLCTGSVFAIYLVALGPDGADLPFQVFDFISPYPYSVGEVCTLCLLIGWVICLGMCALTLLLSASLRSTMPVAVIPLAITFLGILSKFITPLSKIGDLTPMSGLNDMFSALCSYAIGPVVLDLPDMLCLLYTTLLIVCVPRAMRVFARHQVA